MNRQDAKSAKKTNTQGRNPSASDRAAKTMTADVAVLGVLGVLAVETLPFRY